MVKLDKKSVKWLAKWIRTNSGKHGMGWSFTENNGKQIGTNKNDGYILHGKDIPVEEGKLNEGKTLTLPNGVKAEAEEKITEGKADRAFTKIIGLLRKESRKLNDDHSYELGIKLKQWFNKNVM